jgi:hypothetical protein
MGSERDRLATQERREWVAAEEKRQRDTDDRAQYDNYVRELRGSGIEILQFEDWRRHMPEELKDADPVLRGVAASAKAHLQRLARVAVDRIKHAALTDDELAALGFDPSNRMDVPELLSAPGIAMAFEHFAKQDSRCNLKVHFQPMGTFLSTNNLFPSDDHIRLVFNHLYDLHLLPEPEPEPERNPELNQFGVNLNIEQQDPEVQARIDARKRLEEYATRVIMRGPDGREYCQRDLDRLGADETLKVLRYNESLQRL